MMFIDAGGVTDYTTGTFGLWGVETFTVDPLKTCYVVLVNKDRVNLELDILGSNVEAYVVRYNVNI